MLGDLPKRPGRYVVAVFLTALYTTAKFDGVGVGGGGAVVHIVTSVLGTRDGDRELIATKLEAQKFYDSMILCYLLPLPTAAACIVLNAA